MAGYATIRELMAKGYSAAEIDAYLQTRGAPGKVNKGAPESTWRMNQAEGYREGLSKTRGVPVSRAQKPLQARHPDMNVLESQANMAWDDPGGPGEFTAMQPLQIPDIETQALNQGQQLVAQATGSPALPMPEQAVPNRPNPPNPAGPKVNWQNGPSMDFYNQSAGWNMDRGIQMGRMPSSQGMPNLTKSVMEQGGQQQIEQQKSMMETAFANAKDEASQNVLQANRGMLDMFGKNAQNPLLGGSFLGKLFGGLF